MSLLEAFQIKHGVKDGEKLFRAQRKLAAANASYKRTKVAVARRKQLRQ